ncbi:MAG TPA: mandelate racemase/muconate lactonizing enzyme family protein [Dongiaceae bacterium]|jgi:galactonate dehydratase|nr:mandelate racemase/muconate lactonizing enzyme family protein [Dongiaceae bacterium]
MRIADIKCFAVLIGDRNQLIVKVETDTGLVGWGEAGLVARLRAVQGAIEHFRDFLIGQDPFQTNHLWQDMYRSQYFEGGRVLSAAISAIDIALLDIKGKALGVPVYQLLGGKCRDVVPTFASLRAASVDEAVALGREVQKAGWKCIRLLPPDMKKGAPFEPWDWQVEMAAWSVALRRELGPGVCLGMELHHRLSVAEVGSFCQRLPAGTLDFLEEPIRSESPDAYQMLRGMTDVPFAVGEEFSSKWQFLPFVERGLMQYARLDVCNIGGLTEAMKVAGQCEAHYVDMMPHNPFGPICLAASIHFSAAVPNLSWLECRETPGERLVRLKSAIFARRPELDGPVYKIPDQPGLGIEIDEAALSKAEGCKYLEPIHPYRQDGSRANY